MTSGARPGTSGAWLAAAAMASTYAVVTTINIFTALHDRPEVAWWEPVVWEYSSGLAALPCLIIPWLAVRTTPAGTGWLKRALVLGLGSVLFTSLHVSLFILLRHAAYAVVSWPYHFEGGVDGFLYEYRKDVLAYLGAAALFWSVPRLLVERAATIASASRPTSSLAAEPVFEVRDGGRLLRVPHREILAVSSAGNYVEVLLADGRRPLTRMTLAQAEAALSPSGFLRVHRSWLVNAARVRALTPEGSGDYALELDGGVTAPLSRRFPEALQRLRQA